MVGRTIILFNKRVIVVRVFKNKCYKHSSSSAINHRLDFYQSPYVTLNMVKQKISVKCKRAISILVQDEIGTTFPEISSMTLVMTNASMFYFVYSCF